MSSTSTTTGIEKKSLEAHVELCAERYEALESKLQTLEKKVDKLESHIVGIKESLAGVGERQSRQLITIGTAIFTVLITAIIILLVNFVNK
jgi:prefoldin subunit 5